MAVIQSDGRHLFRIEPALEHFHNTTQKKMLYNRLNTIRPLQSEHSFGNNIPSSEKEKDTRRGDHISMPDLPKGTVTLLFTDMEGSTRLLQQLGDRYASVLADCRQLIRSAFARWNGHEVDTQGDAFFVVFARANDALLAALDIQRALIHHTWAEGVTVRVRIGMHTGEPQLSPDGYIGVDVHHAARIMSAAHGAQVLLSQTTRELVEQTLPEGVSLRDLGSIV